MSRIAQGIRLGTLCTMKARRDCPFVACSSVSIVLGYGLDDRVSKSRRRLGIFLFITVSRTALGYTQPPIQWVTGVLSLGVKRPGREGDHSPPSSAEVKNAWSYTPTPQYTFMAWCSVKAQRQLYLYLQLGSRECWEVHSTFCLMPASPTLRTGYIMFRGHCQHVYSQVIVLGL
jgi:hypothetical protein